MTIETRFDIPFVAGLALREKQIQQHYRPIIAVHKWFARRPGALFRALALAEFGDAALSDLYFTANDFPGRKVADPFMGGGTPLIEANRVGCDVTGFDINPMSAWIVREATEHLDLEAYEDQASRLLGKLRGKIEILYLTDCPLYGDADVPVKYFLWVKVIDCETCGEAVDLFPGYLLSEDSRHPKNVLVCPGCGDLNEVADRKSPGACGSCKTALRTKGPARRNRCVCLHCGHENHYGGGTDKLEGCCELRLVAMRRHSSLFTAHGFRPGDPLISRQRERLSMERHLAAILAADVVGYSRLIGEDETGTHQGARSPVRRPGGCGLAA